MSERGQQHGLNDMAGIEISERPLAVNGIPGDGTNGTSLNILYLFGDVSLGISHPSSYLYPMAFKSHYGGAAFPMIAEELSVIPDSFRHFQGRNDPSIERPLQVEDTFKHVGTRVVIDNAAYSVLGLGDDNEEPDNATKEMNIHVLESGNVLLEFLDSRFESHASILFKTEKNAGRFPIMAASFTRIAERIKDAYEGDQKRR